MDSIQEVLSKYKKELGPLSSLLVDQDPEYREKIIKEAEVEVGKLLVKRMKLEAILSDLPAQIVPRDDLPAFKKEPPKKVLTFKLM
jgi:hypothetical protein